MMHHSNEIVKPVIGKTYSLYGENNSTLHFYQQIHNLIDICLNIYPDKIGLLNIIQKESKNPGFLQKRIKKNLPVVGVPLDANCCVRWMGEFHLNTVNLEKLSELISET